MITMRYGDCAWIKGLKNNTSLNGKRVTLQDWRDDAQRWRCVPVDWKHSHSHISVRPRNLCNEPPTSDAGTAGTAGTYTAARLMSLMNREQELSARVSPTNVLRHKMCKLKLLEVQMQLFEQQHDRQDLAERARELLLAHASLVAKATGDWLEGGHALPDFWDDGEDDEDDPEQDPDVQRWMRRERGGAPRAAFDPPLQPATLL